MAENIAKVESAIADPLAGLPEEVFLFASRIMPMINVDLLIKNPDGATLLTWRDDGYAAPGWHIPGGVIRYKEAIAVRIRKVAQSELGTGVEFKPEPVTIKEFIHSDRKNRGHFISLLFECRLTGMPDEKIRYQQGKPLPGQWMWHAQCPENLLSVHEIYCKFI
jgi:colanic acid biosynthesis protein WcaH